MCIFPLSMAFNIQSVVETLLIGQHLTKARIHLVVLVQSLSHVWLFATPMDCSTPGLPVFHCLPELALNHVYWGSDAIQPSHLLSPSSPAFSLSQHQGLFQWIHLFTLGGQSIGASSLASVLPMNVQGWFPVGLTSLISLLSEGFSRVFFNTTFLWHQFLGTQPFFFVQFSHPYMTTGKAITDYMDLCRQSNVSTAERTKEKLVRNEIMDKMGTKLLRTKQVIVTLWLLLRVTCCMRFLGPQNKVPQAGWIKTAYVYSVTVLVIRNLKLRFQQWHSPSAVSRGDFLLTFLTAGGDLRSLAPLGFYLH